MSAIDTFWEFFAVAVGLLVVIGGLAATLLRGRGGATKDLPRERPTTPSRRRVAAPDRRVGVRRVGQHVSRRGGDTPGRGLR